MLGMPVIEQRLGQSMMALMPSHYTQVSRH